jgi:glycogen debranching enzyme
MPRQVLLELELACPIADVEFEEEMKIEAKVPSNEFQVGLLPQVKWSREQPILRYERIFGYRAHSPHDELGALLGENSPKDGEPVARGLSISVGVHNPQNCVTETRLFSGNTSKLRFPIHLLPRAQVEVMLHFQPTLNGQIIQCPKEGPERFSPLPRNKSDFPKDNTVFRTGNSTLNQIIAQAQVDLELLRLPANGPQEVPLQKNPLGSPFTFSAGIPRYIGVFGRDTLTTAWQAALFSPRYLEPALSLTGLLRGVQEDAWRDEEPDRILHERRLNPMAALGQSNREIYYGDVASTPFWIVALAAAYNWTGDRGLIKRHLDTFEACCRWMTRRLEEGHGFIYYAPALPDTPGSNPNQAWKDSDDAIVDGNGRNRNPPHAAAEIQGYCYLAFISAAEISIALGNVKRARSFLKKATALKRRFNQAFWLPEKGFYALALDANGKPIDAIASNIAQCLGTGVIARDKMEPVVRRLFSPELYSGWGIRTLSSDNPAYDPFSYHRGSVWPVENSTIAAGLAVSGYIQEATELISSQFALATLFPNMRLPEVISGHERNEEYPAPGLYPQANLIQSWSVSAISLYMQILFGIRPLAPLRTLLLKPVLPEWLPWAEIHGLRIGQVTISLRFWRDKKGKSHWRVLKREGFLMILEQPPELSPEATLGNRLSDVFRSTRRFLFQVGATAAVVALSRAYLKRRTRLSKAA